MREQVCLWICPYSRLQSVMYDKNTLLPSYDEQRGEPRAKLSKRSAGACVDCDQCLAVCPTGIDIREGQQIGCITCGLCIDACDNVMKKINRPTGLIRYASLNQLQNITGKKILRRPQVLVAIALIAASVFATTYGLSNMTPAEFSVINSRQPMYVLMSDNSVKNRYQARIFNKTDEDHQYTQNC
ncbi:4Fe-4S dicluster domain-containing protein [Pseudomonadota bacterium]